MKADMSTLKEQMASIMEVSEPTLRREGDAWLAGCVFHERNTRGVATNVYLGKTLEKPEKTWSTNFKWKGSGVVFMHGEGISTPHVRHKRRQPLIKYANMTLIFTFPFTFLYLLYPFYIFPLFVVDKGVSLCFYVFLNCDEEIRPT